MPREFTQEDIEAVFQENAERASSPGSRAVPFDFRRPDRIAKSQLRGIHMLHDSFVRNLVSSLSAYLRSYVTVNLVSFEQLSYAEFLDWLPSPTCLVSLNLHPVEGSALLELNQSLVFPILETLLGGTGKRTFNAQREVTEIEQNIMEGFFRVVLHDLEEAWRPVTDLRFVIDKIGTEPEFVQILAPTEAVVAVAIELRLGEHIGMMNIAMPSIIIKMLRQKFDQQWLMRKTEVSDAEQQRIVRVVKNATVHLDARLEGPQIPVQDLLALKEGDVLAFDYPLSKPVVFLVNGARKFTGHIGSSGRKRTFRVEGRLLKKTED